MKHIKFITTLLIMVIFSSACTIKSQKLKEAKLLKAKVMRENRKDIDELETRSNAIFFEPDPDAKGTTSYELDNFLNTKPSQRFIIQDPKVLEVYSNGDNFDMYVYLGPNVVPKVYSYIFKVEKIRKEDLDSILMARGDEDSRVFLVLKKLKVTSLSETEVETSRISKQVVAAEFVSLAKVASVKSSLENKLSSKVPAEVVKE